MIIKLAKVIKSSNFANNNSYFIKQSLAQHDANEVILNH